MMACAEGAQIIGAAKPRTTTMHSALLILHYLAASPRTPYHLLAISHYLTMVVWFIPQHRHAAITLLHENDANHVVREG